MVACELGNTAAVQLFLEAGADVEVKTEEGITALHLASLDGHYDITKLLIAAGAEVEAVVKTGETPMDFATQEGHGRVAALLQAAAAKKGGRQAGAESDRQGQKHLLAACCRSLQRVFWAARLQARGASTRGASPSRPAR